MTNKTFYEKSPGVVDQHGLKKTGKAVNLFVTVEDSRKDVEEIESKDEGVGMGPVALLEAARGPQSL